MRFLNPPTEKERLLFYEYMKGQKAYCECGILQRSILGSDIHYYKIGKGKRFIVSVGAHHALEHISTAVLFNVIDKMLENLTRPRVSYGANLEFLLQKFTFWFVPCLNPDGVELVLSGARESPLIEREIRMNGGEDFSRWQANARGVDLNHNYDFRFAEYKALERREGIFAGKTRYSGEYPESEPESRAMAALLRTIMPDALLSFHSQGELVYPRPRGSASVMRLAKACAAALGYSVSSPSGLADYGGLSDYAGEYLGVPSFTVELGRGENPLPYSLLPSLTERVFKLHVLLPSLI